ncbi:hypothetical protein NDU88_000188 [Pleurodeles waltl]|uniref:Ubiquitin-related modifier 1 n=1 Tax=Pleurodeles waltl TaxID=8319 RepID=A0AAV7Q0H8_PLEWA|nr:hypothetical protein NDU88_000188 [Pleurodeles waltl]
MMAAPVSLLLEFGGGAELLFDGIKKHHVTLPIQTEPWDVRHLLTWIRENLLKERPELFIQGESVRPGILVLINDSDWELMGELDYTLQNQDNVVFISTLHGDYVLPGRGKWVPLCASYTFVQENAPQYNGSGTAGEESSPLAQTFDRVLLSCKEALFIP